MERESTWTVKLRVATRTDVTLEVTRGNGNVTRSLVNQSLDVGDYEFTWDGRDDSNRPVERGRHFIQLNAGEYSETLKLMEK